MKTTILTVAILIAQHFTINAQSLTNGGFENWTGIEPNGWITFNAIPGAPQTTFKQTVSPGQGLTSVKLKTASCPSCSSFFLSNPLGGIVSYGSDAAGTPYTLRPLSIDFKYKSIPLGGDQGGVLVQLTHWNSITNSTDVVGEAWFVSSINVTSWTSVNLPITYSSLQVPDTLIVQAFSSIGHSMFPLPGIPTPVIGSEFYIDAFNLNLPSCAGFSLSVSGTNESAPLAANGTAIANPSGGLPPYSYAWNNLSTNQSITGLTQGLYNVIATDANGCSKMGSYNVLKGGCNGLSVSVTGTQATSFSANNGFASATVTGGTPPYQYQWNTGPTTASISGLDIGAYVVQVIDATGNCVQWGYFPNNISAPVGIKKYDLNNSISIYPNPSNGLSIIKTDSGMEGFFIYNTLGEIIASGKTKEINISEHPTGLYYINIIMKDKTSTTFKIVKQ